MNRCMALVRRAYPRRRAGGPPRRYAGIGWLFGLLLLGSASASPALAQPGKAVETAQASPEDARQREAKRSFLDGRARYNEGKYRAALESFEHAYGLDPRPEMLYNLAQCHHKLGELEPALTHYRRFLEERPLAKNRKEVEARIHELELQLKGTPPDDGQPASGTDPNSTQQTQAASPPQPVPAPPPGPEPPSPFRRGRLRLLVDLGFGALTKDVYSRYIQDYFNFSASGAFGVGVQHRPISWLAYGLRFTWSYQALAAAALSAGNAQFFDGSLVAEFYPLKITRFDPFISVGLGFGQVTMNMEYNGTAYSHVLRGPTLHLGTGLQVFVNSFIGVGLALRYMHGFWLQYCGNGLGADTCYATDDLYDEVSSTLPGMFFLGAEGAFNFF